MKRRGIVVVHGVGQQQPGDQLDIVLQPLVDFLGQCLGYANVSVCFRRPPDASSVAQADVHLKRKGAVFEVWHVREAWWARSFRPSPSSAVVAWALRALAANLAASWWQVVVPNWRTLRSGDSGYGSGVWRVPAGGRPFAACNVVTWLFIAAMTIAAYAAAPLAALMVVAISRLLVVGFLFPGPPGRLMRSVMNLLTGGLGDQQAMTARSVCLAEAASTVVAALEPFLDARSAEPLDCDSVTVVAHSCGCIVSFEALAGEQVRTWLEAEDYAGPRRINWITAGSGLNLAWHMRDRRSAAEIAFWQRAIGSYVNWIDVYARYDPVPVGPAPRDMAAALSADCPAAYIAVRVANDDWPPTEHGSYWRNFAEGMSRVVHVISDSRLAGPNWPAVLHSGDYGGGPLAAGIKAAVEFAGPDHRRRLAVRSLLRNVGLAVAAMAAVALWIGVHT